jgi:hypothetical protein
LRRNLQPADCRPGNCCHKLISTSVMLFRNVPRDMPFDNRTICLSFRSYPIPSPTLPLKGRESTSNTFRLPTTNHIEPLFFKTRDFICSLERLGGGNEGA